MVSNRVYALYDTITKNGVKIVCFKIANLIKNEFEKKSRGQNAETRHANHILPRRFQGAF